MFRHVPELSLQDCREQAMEIAFKLVGYGGRVAKRKEFSDDPVVMKERVAFAREGLNWTLEGLFLQISSYEVWAIGGGY